MLIESLNGKELFWKASIDADLVGYVVVLEVLEQLELLNIAVRKSYQGLGIGQTLLNFLEKYARDNSIKKVFLEVRESNTVAINLYKKFNFEQVGYRKNYYSTKNGKENGLVMVLNFNADEIQ